MKSLSKEREDDKNNTVIILELKNTIIAIKSSVDELNTRMEGTGEGSSELKIEQLK